MRVAIKADIIFSNKCEQLLAYFKVCMKDIKLCRQFQFWGIVEIT